MLRVRARADLDGWGARQWCIGGRCTATGMLGETMPAGDRLRWGGGKRGEVVGNGELKDVVPNVEPVMSHAGVNMAGPPAC